ncbi:sugar-binding transcriptional regulator [Desulforamulus aeronauticus]|uniref:Deoxyribonucleoside regulator n=1 Tax=Desulforamulus aeronauticus DSM 10349 TaxID=1121421 RepID=A0A1M6TLF1_9FIRM|nr:sugar-binding transcriptional regulator [Desulforamulus aeronauticus]SHK57598.1 deoxyribonucleoside regulator [Desulforamulus aeronauticus DSM 10349]
MAGIDNDLQLVKIARLYYELGYKQEQIAQIEKISKATVSRLLDKAHKEGIVEVKVVYPQLEVHELAEEIRERFNLKKACVVPVMIDHPDVIRDDLGRAVSNFLSEIIRDEDIIGVSWGTTLPFVVKNLSKINANNVIVTQLNGGVTKHYLSTQSAAIIEGFVNSLNAVPYMLPVPTIVDSVELATAISADSNVCKTLELSQKARIAVYGIGKAGFDSILVQAGYFQKEEYEKLLQAGAVGDICSRYFRIDGSIVDQELNQRTVGITLEELRNKEYSIAVANGEEKAKAVVGALKGKYVNTLFIDEVTAKKCLELIKSEE